jgi:hypothetical protein
MGVDINPIQLPSQSLLLYDVWLTDLGQILNQTLPVWPRLDKNLTEMTSHTPRLHYDHYGPRQPLQPHTVRARSVPLAISRGQNLSPQCLKVDSSNQYFQDHTANACKWPGDSDPPLGTSALPTASVFGRLYGRAGGGSVAFLVLFFLLGSGFHEVRALTSSTHPFSSHRRSVWMNLQPHRRGDDHH